MHMSANVSVVIPLYNKCHHIHRAIDSVLAQTFADFELIVVDDGSTDGSGVAVRRCADPRIRLIVQENAGVSAARNRGAAEAKSKLVAFLDADDEWQPDFLETVLKLRNRFPQASVWSTSYSVVGADSIHFQPEFPGTAVANSEGGLIDYFQSPGPWMPVHASAFMVQKDALAKAGGFSVELRCGEDWDTWIRLALRYPIAWWPDAKAVLHQNAGNRTDEYCYIGVAPYLRNLQDFFQEAGPDVRIGEHVYQHVARCHMRLLKGNWLAGDRKALKRILDDCRGIRGLWLKSFLWQCLSCFPHRVVVAGWKLRQHLARRSPDLPPFRDIRRP